MGEKEATVHECTEKSNHINLKISLSLKNAEPEKTDFTEK